MKLQSAARRAFPACLLALALPSGGGAPDLGTGFATIREKDVAAHLSEIASPELEGRDSPSPGLERAAAYIEGRLREWGLQPVADDSYRMTFTREYVAPALDRCVLEFRRGGEDPVVLEAGVDFVPLPVCRGEAQGSLVFCGFGITETKERYDDLKSVKVKGRVAMILEGEPRHRKLFEGAEELTKVADVHLKVKHLAEAGAVGVLVVRRPPPERARGADGEYLDPPTLGYRYSWARWNDGRGYPDQPREPGIPVLELTEASASRLLGEDVAELGRRIDKRGRPEKRELDDVQVFLETTFQQAEVPLDNVVGVIPGSDEELAGEYLVLGAHYDHIGVDPWGRVGYGADDNGSGTVALLEVAEALARAQPRRSVICAFFSAEEDGLIGSRRFCDDPPVPREAMIAMINMDMLGRGETDELYVLGTHVNPAFEDLLKRAKKLKPTKVKEVETGSGRDLWQRSDHYSFHEIGLPVLFFFENYPETENKDYHTYRDTIESLDLDKITRSARFVYNTAWLCANDDERPPRPE